MQNYPKPRTKPDERAVMAMLPADLYVRLKARCASDRTSLKFAVTQAIFDYLNKDKTDGLQNHD